MKKILIGIAVLVALVIGAALVVPALIDWSRYKEAIATRIEKATGRDVDIAGDVGLRLLPTPAFTARNVTIGNLPEAGDQPFAAVDALSIRLRLLPLLTGKVAVESLVLERPAVHLVRLPDGRANWQFASAQDAPGGDAAPAQAAPEPQQGQQDGGITFNQVTLHDGIVTYRDGKADPVTVESIDANLDSGGPAGPFLTKGTLTLRGTRIAFDGALDRVAEGRGSPAHLTLTLPDTDTRAEFSGMLSHLPTGDTVRGRLVVSAADAGGVLPGLPNAAFNADGTLAASSKEVTLDELVATLGETRATGAATIGLGQRPSADVKLNVAGLDLDKWLAGRPARHSSPPQSVAQPAGRSQPDSAPAPAGQFTLPKDLFVTAELGVETMAWKGEVVRQARIEAILDQGEIMIQGATAQLPGGTVVSLAGTLAAERGQPVFDGQAEARSDNLRAVLDWQGIDVASVPADRLHRFEASTAIRAALPQLELKDLHLRLDATNARGNLTARLTERPFYGVALALDSFNLDGYRGGGKAAPDASAPARPQGGDPASPADPAPTPAKSRPLTSFDADIRLTAKNLTAFGRNADDLTVDAAVDAESLVIRQLSGRIDGLPLRLSGRLAEQGGTYALDAKGIAAGLDVAARGTVAPPRYDLVLQAGHASFAQAMRLLSPTYRPAGTIGALTVNAKVAGGPERIDVAGLEMRAGTARLTGHGSIALAGKPAITAKLAANAIDLDSFLPAERTGSLLPGSIRLPPAAPSAPAAPIIPTATAGGTPFSSAPLDLSALRAVDAKVQLRAESLDWQGWKLDAAQAALAIEDGNGAIDRLTGKLLGGDLDLSARLTTAATPALTGTMTIAGANLGQVKLGAGDIRVTQGRLDAETKFQTAGRSTHDMAGRLQGNGRLLVTDGTVSGFDLPAVNRQLNSIENVGGLLGLAQAGMSGGTTRFSRLAGTFTAENGVVVSRDLKLEAQGATATAETVVRLQPWTMQTAIAVALAEQSAPPLVVRLEGPIGNPRKVIDVNALQQYLVARGLGRALRGKSTEQQQQGQSPPSGKPNGPAILRDLLKGLGGR